jgi:hypothetical protein
MVEIEILRKGQAVSSNGTEVDLNDELLDQVVESYNPTNFKAPLIVSHNTGGQDDASLAESELAYGFPVALKRVGDRVRAVFDKVSPQFVQWNRDGRLLGISPSLYPPTAPANPTPGRWSLRHIAGLGASPPAIKGLSPLALSELTDDLDNWVLDLNEFSQPADDAVSVAFDLGENSLESAATTIMELASQMQSDPEEGYIPDSPEGEAVQLILSVAQQMKGSVPDVAEDYDTIVAAARTVLDVAAKVAGYGEVEEPEDEDDYESEDYEYGGRCKKYPGCGCVDGCAMKKNMQFMMAKVHGSKMNFGAGHNKNKAYYNYEEPLPISEGDTMSDAERDELELLRAEREALQQEVRAARIESLVSFCEAYRDRFTPAMTSPVSVDFGEESHEMDAVDFMASLNGAQLAWFKEMVKSMPPQVDFEEIATDDKDPGYGDDLSFEEQLQSARQALQKSFNTAGGLE